MLYHNEQIINAETLQSHLGNDTDRICGTIARDFAAHPVGSIAGAPAKQFPLIPRSEWPDRISQMEKDKSRISDLIVFDKLPVANQEYTLFCWAYSCCAAVKVMRAQQGQPYVSLSPESIAGPVNGYRNQGNYIARALQQVTTVGIASEQFVPHLTIEASGFKSGWKDNAALHRAEEFWDLGDNQDGLMTDRILTCLFNRFPVPTNYQWWGHSVLAVDPWMRKAGRNSGQYVFGNRIWNSWGDGGSYGFSIVEEPHTAAVEAYALRSIRLG